MNDAAARPRAVLADDERLMRDQLRARLAEVWPELELVAEARHGQEAVEQVEAHRPDVVFLDIRMPGMTGIDAARAIAQLDVGDDGWLPEVVFITAYDAHAVEAFEQGAADYVLKPAERDRLQRTVARLKARLAARRAVDAAASSGAGAEAAPPATAPAGVDAPARAADAEPERWPLQQLLHRLASGTAAAAPRLEWIQASVGSGIQMIAVDDVLFFVSDEKYTRVQTATQEALIRKPIKELVDELDPQQFWQIHRSTLVAVKAIAGVTRDFRGRQIVQVKGHPQKLEVSRSYAGLFKGM